MNLIKNQNGKTKLLRNEDLITQLKSSQKKDLLEQLQQVHFPFKDAGSSEGFFLKHIIQKATNGK